MASISLTTQLVALGILLVLSGFFSMAETAMMASNRYRLKAAAKAKSRGAQLAIDLLAKTDKLLGVILLFNNLINAAAATLTGVIATSLFGEGEVALAVGTLVITFLILVFSEITPKVIGAGYANAIAPMVAFVLAPLLKIFYPVIWTINLLVSALLHVTRLRPGNPEDGQTLSADELRALVTESGHFIPAAHRRILINLFELEDVTVEDVMTPRNQIEAIDLELPLETLQHQIVTSHHGRVPVFEGELDRMLGVLPQRRVVSALATGDLDRDEVRSLLTKPYFVPSATPLYSQLQFFQENRQRLALVVNEYGEVEGLVTLEDIIEEIVGKFTTGQPGSALSLTWTDGSVIVDGSRSLRELNGKLGLNLPLDGPKTLNGLLLEHLQDIPESGVSVRIGKIAMEILHTEDRMVRSVRLFKPRERKADDAG
ncbi:MAG: HlyC/CorC family transporter [Gammaproteobacteria bacterium]|jgi:Mg2+/Co2+ transporter CorB|nr:HlyC/CorC family transporter [Gammaproteobacteria bacterium]MBU0858210.1 HlyC/CorC family transporter [Gammaproteobacteria bacterium]MBU1846548.1 HlyC/CorC family transporter [Gammaproteobacteria bacterium]